MLHVLSSHVMRARCQKCGHLRDDAAQHKKAVAVLHQCGFILPAGISQSGNPASNPPGNLPNQVTKSSSTGANRKEGSSGQRAGNQQTVWHSQPFPMMKNFGDVMEGDEVSGKDWRMRQGGLERTREWGGQ